MQGRGHRLPLGPVAAVLLVLAMVSNSTFRGGSGGREVLISKPPPLLPEAAPQAGNSSAGSATPQAGQPAPIPSSGARPSRDCSGEMGALPDFELEGAGGGLSCSSTLPLPSVVVGWDDSFDGKMSALCSREGQRLSYVRVPERHLDPDVPVCEEAEPFATARSTWTAVSAPHLMHLRPAIVQSFAINSRQHYRDVGRYINANRPVEAVMAVVAPSYASHPFGREPLPGVAVLHNARFYKEGWAHDCRTFVAASSRGCAMTPPTIPKLCDGATVMCQSPTDEHLRACMPGQGSGFPRYGRVVTMAQHYGHFYFHFIAENLTRLMLLLHELRADNEAVVHVLDKGPPFVLQALELIGVDASRVIAGDGCARTLFIPETVRCGGPTVPLLHITRRWIRGLLLPCPVPPAKSEQQYIVLIKRHGVRQVINHDDVRRTLQQALDSERMALHVHEGTVALRDQWELFVSATGLIGPHGAGMTNMIVMRAGSVVVEFLIAGADINICYVAMSLQLKHIYRAVSPLMGRQESNMLVEPGRVAGALREALHERRKGNTTRDEGDQGAASKPAAGIMPPVLDALTGNSAASQTATQPTRKKWTFLD